MTVSELIEALSKLDGDTLVVLNYDDYLYYYELVDSVSMEWVPSSLWLYDEKSLKIAAAVIQF
jgi:hypothetical protein